MADVPSDNIEVTAHLGRCASYHSALPVIWCLYVIHEASMVRKTELYILSTLRDRINSMRPSLRHRRLACKVTGPWVPPELGVPYSSMGNTFREPFLEDRAIVAVNEQSSKFKNLHNYIWQGFVLGLY